MTSVDDVFATGNTSQGRTRCDSGSESLDNREPRDILDCHVERRDQSFAVAERE
jgi:hypothetical protein